MAFLWHLKGSVCKCKQLTFQGAELHLCRLCSLKTKVSFLNLDSWDHFQWAVGAARLYCPGGGKPSSHPVATSSFPPFLSACPLASFFTENFSAPTCTSSQPSLPVLGGSVCPPVHARACPLSRAQGHPSGKSPLPSASTSVLSVQAFSSAAHPPALRSKDSS